MMFENQFKKRKRSSILNGNSKDKGKLVYLPSINKMGETIVAESHSRDMDSTPIG